jgi:hypothetical protein
MKFRLSWRSLIRIALKATALFILINIAFALLNPVSALGSLSIYNLLVRGRERLPYGESPAAYNLSLYDLNTMFSSHEINGRRGDDETRVLIIGDSSVWGILLENADTLSSCLNDAALTLNDLPARLYNMGYPTMSATKDLMLLDEAMRYDPDLIVWLVTLESLPNSEQLAAPIAANNAPRIRDLISRYELNLDPNDARLITPTFAESTLVGQRRAMADWWRLQLYGFNWAATGIDQVFPEYTPRSNDFEADTTWYDFDETNPFAESDLALDVIDAGMARAGDIPVLLVNEPIFIADGVNSDLRYNFWYPRWAYNQYRAVMDERAAENNWHYLDLWDAVSPSEFTDSPVHLTPAGSRILCERIVEQLEND